MNHLQSHMDKAYANACANDAFQLLQTLVSELLVLFVGNLPRLFSVVWKQMVKRALVQPRPLPFGLLGRGPSVSRGPPHGGGSGRGQQPRTPFCTVSLTRALCSRRYISARCQNKDLEGGSKKEWALICTLSSSPPTKYFHVMLTCTTETWTNSTSNIYSALSSTTPSTNQEQWFVNC